MSLEIELDKLLKIKTSGRDDSHSNLINFPYEATPYLVLQALSNTICNFAVSSASTTILPSSRVPEKM